MEIGLSLGSNLGDRAAMLRAARDRIAALPGVAVVAQAPLYETEPVGVKPEYRHLAFLNTVLVLETDTDPVSLRRWLAGIEADLGRQRVADKFAPRAIDIDMLYAGGLESAHADLTLPHPRWALRRFVLQPLADVRPDLVLPGAAGTVAQCLERLEDTAAIRRLATAW
jgi:2-amino-4-hydroxy-6-hydroxymethyldihydropteridine diphosphokinase